LNGANCLDDLFAHQGTGFRCKMCGNCCELDVLMTEHDLKRIEARFPNQVAKTERIRRMGKIAGGRLYSPLFAGADSRVHCIFLEGNSCSVHEAKPLLCALYPFFPIPIDRVRKFTSGQPGLASVKSSDGTSYLISVDQDCKGVSMSAPPVDWVSIVRLWEQFEAESAEEIT